MLVGFPLDTAKLPDLITYTLLAGAAFGAVALIHSALDHKVAATIGRGSVLFTAATLGLILVGVFAQQAIATMPWVKEQQAATVPTKLLHEVTTATHGQYTGKVFLTDLETLPQYLPVSTFNTWKANYANPAGLFEQRARFLQRVATERDPSVVAAALKRNRYDGVDWIALRRDGDNFVYTFADDAFPNGVAIKTIKIPATAFATFEHYYGTVVTVLKPRLVPLTSDQRSELESHFLGDLTR